MSAKVPSWLDIKTTQVGDRRIVRIRVRRWHPRYWRMYWSSCYRAAREIEAPFYQWFSVALFNFFVSRRTDTIYVKDDE